MRKLTTLCTIALIAASSIPVSATGLDYGDYAEAFNAKDRSLTYYVYKSSIRKAANIIDLKAVEVRSNLQVSLDQKGEPFIALKYKFRFDCQNRKYAAAMTSVLRIESGWRDIHPAEVKKEEGVWLTPTDSSFGAAMVSLFCK